MITSQSNMIYERPIECQTYKSFTIVWRRRLPKEATQGTLACDQQRWGHKEFRRLDDARGIEDILYVVAERFGRCHGTSE